MSQWAGGVLTAAGRVLQAKVESGTTLTLTKIKLGDGTESMSAVDNLTDLVSPKAVLGISSATSDGDVATITGVMSATLLQAGFYCREWGLFAQDPDAGEILYMITIDSQPEWLPASTEAAQVSATYAMNIAVANATNIEVNIDPAGLVDVDMLNELLGVAERSKAYNVGDLVSMPGLPAEHYLRCVTAGTTGANMPVIGTVADGDLIADGTVVWQVTKAMSAAELGFRQPSTAYAVGAIAYHASLPTGWYLECTTAGTTSSSDLTISSPSIGGTVTDGTVTWTICNVHAGTFNKKQTFTSSGTFTAPVSGTYKITLQGAGGGGGGCSNNTGGAGGGQGGHGYFYANLTAGASYPFVIGAGGAGGTVGNAGVAGGITSITINSTVYDATGGTQGAGEVNGSHGGDGGAFRINGVYVIDGYGAAGGLGEALSSAGFINGGQGGGQGGGPSYSITSDAQDGVAGGGGSGGGAYHQNDILTKCAGASGGDGYITFEWFDV